MMITHKLDMDLQQRGMLPRIDMVQGDANTRELELTLFSDGEVWNVPGDAAVWMRYCKSNGAKGIYDTLADGTVAWTAEENVLTVALEPQMLTEAGVVLAQVEIVQGADSLATFAIQIVVERNVAADVLQSEDYVNMLQWMEAELERLLAKARDSGEFDGPQGPQGLQGESGPTVFAYAGAAGYAGTEEEFARMLITPCLPLSGGTMAGNIAMSGNKLTGLGAPEEASDAVTKAYMDAKRQVITVTLAASGWTETAPYTQVVFAPGMQLTDLPRMEPLYIGTVATDALTYAAFSCISYGVPQNNRMSFYCMESRPESSITVMLEVLR